MGIQYDDFGNLWLAHNDGLTRVDQRTGSIKHFASRLGVTAEEYNSGASYKSPDGMLYFGSQGVTYLDGLLKISMNGPLIWALVKSTSWAGFPILTRGCAARCQRYARHG